MNTSHDNEFAEVRRLLSLKRHEQPPPGYFNRFSAEVVASIKAERRGRRRAHSSEHAPAWIVSLLERLQARPALSGALGAGLCALAIGGILVSDNDARGPAAMPSLLSEVTPSTQPAPLSESSSMEFQPVTADYGIPLMASNALQATSTLFDSIPGLDTATVGYR